MYRRRPRLLVSNVAVNCSEAHIAEWVKSKGYEVESVVLIRDTISETSPSFAHVFLKNPEILDHALRALDGQILYGRKIEVSRIERRPWLLSSQGPGRDLPKPAVF